MSTASHLWTSGGYHDDFDPGLAQYHQALPELCVGDVPEECAACARELTPATSCPRSEVATELMCRACCADTVDPCVGCIAATVGSAA